MTKKKVTKKTPSKKAAASIDKTPAVPEHAASVAVVKNEGTTLVVKPASELPAIPRRALGAAECMDARDVAIPTVILMQAKSTFVEDESSDIKIGDFVHSMTEEVLGHKDKKPLKFVSCYMFKTYQIFHGEGDNAKYINTEAWTPARSLDEYQSIVQVDGKDVMETRKLVYNHCGYLPDHTRQVGERVAASPVIVKFKGLSKKHCKKQINSYITDLSDFNQASWQYEFILTSKIEDTAEYGKYQVWQSALGDKVSKKLDDFGYILYQRFKSLQDAGKLEASDKEDHTPDVQSEEKQINEKEIPAEAKKVSF